LQDTLRHKGLRIKLLEDIRSKGIHHPTVLHAMEIIPRHFFIEPEFEHFAYIDKPFSIGYGQTISQPYTVAYQTWLLDPKEGENILEIGSGSGYQAAILSACRAKVTSLERIPELHQKAQYICCHLLQLPIHFVLGDGSMGYEPHAPYHKILVTAAAPSIPPLLLQQLIVGGQLVIPVGEDKSQQQMLRVTRTGEQSYSTETFGPFVFVPLIGTDGWKETENKEDPMEKM